MDFTYSGKWGVQKEEYNLYYMRDRYYSNELHRFLSLDKDQGDLYRPSTLNPYAYVGNDPINFIDPSGMVAVEIGSAIKQVLLGDLSGEFTLVGMVARIGSSFFGFDILGDIGDLVDSLIHFDFSLEAFVNLGINTIGLLPVFGVVKNVKYVDKAIDSVKGLGKGAYQLGKRTIGGATKFALKAGVKVADYAKTGYKAASNAVGTGLNKASSFFGASSTKQVASAVEGTAPRRGMKFNLQFFSAPAGNVVTSGAKAFTGTLQDAANKVAKEFGSSVEPLTKGYKIDIPYKKKGILVKIMSEESGQRGTKYFRVSIPDKGSLTLDGKISSDLALTHINMTDDYLNQITSMVKKFTGE